MWMGLEYGCKLAMGLERGPGLDNGEIEEI